MCIKAFEVVPLQLHDDPNHFKTHVKCDDTVCKDSYSLKHVLDWILTQGLGEIWRADDDCCNDDEFVECYNCYKNRKAQKAEIKDMKQSVRKVMKDIEVVGIAENLRATRQSFSKVSGAKNGGAYC